MDFDWVRVVVDKDRNLFTTLVDYGELISGVRFQEPRAKVSLILIGLGKRSLPLVRDTLVLVKVGKEVDNECVHLVKLVVVGAFDSLHSVGIAAELKEDISLGSSIISHWIMLVDQLAKLAVDLADHILQLFNTFSSYNWDSVNNND